MIKKLTALVTGATGFIGSHLAKKLKEEGEKVVSLIHHWPDWIIWLNEALDHTVIVKGDIRDFHFLKWILNHYSVDKVFHLSAQSIVKKAYKDPINTYDINVMGTVKLLEACRQLDVERVLVQSTDKIYGNQMEATTESKLIPTEPYGTSKICMDVIAQSFAETYGMDIHIVRCCNVYGYDYNDRIVPNTVRSCLRNENPIIYKNDKSLRQYIHVLDVTSFLSDMVSHPKFYDSYWRGEKSEWKKIENLCPAITKTQEEVVLDILKYFSHLNPCYVEKPPLKEITIQSMKPTINPDYLLPFDKGIQLTIDAFRKYGI